MVILHFSITKKTYLLLQHSLQPQTSLSLFLDCLSSKSKTAILFGLRFFPALSHYHSMFHFLKPLSQPHFAFNGVFPCSEVNLTPTIFMENLLSHLLLCLLLLSVQVLSLPYSPPDKYFVNCGSRTTIVDDTSRNFIGDLDTSVTLSFMFTSGTSREVEMDPSSLYHSVRIFNQPAFYEFAIDQEAVHIVRIHFSPFNFRTDLSTALFDVSATGFFLLKNVTATNIIGNDPASIKEFFLRLKPGKLRINFLPKSLSIAYVNAIEVFPTPPNFILSEALPLISDGRNDGMPKVLPSLILHTIYRVNVGGPEIPPNGDRLWRKWEKDDAYLLNPSSAKNSDLYATRPSYKNEDDDYFAPDLVYRTAKEMNNTTSSSPIRWSFLSRKHARHFLRVHFYDIVGKSFHDFLVFNLFIGDRFSRKINPREGAGPFHNDFLVDSGERGFVNVGVGPLDTNESVQFNAYLNGVEIMELLDEHSKDPDIIEPEETKKKNKYVGVGLAVGSFGLFCILGCVIWFGWKWRKPKTASSSPILNLNLELKLSLAEIKTATNNFNQKFFVGEGGFGKVYKGIMSNGMKVAVKRSQPGHGQGISEFEREITTLSRIRHGHLVSLIGYCNEGLEMILVYEFMENGTLREHLYNSKLPPLHWKKRLEICIGAARGLHYLHKGSATGIIHRDVKSTNILLDENFVAKVSDFGLSRAGSLDETHVSTDIKGTFGYLDPEYFRSQHLTEKSDVYSFGVLLMEVLCARLALDPTLPREQINLAEWGLRCKKMELFEEIIDPKLKGQIDPNSLRKFSDTIEKCLEDNATNRPTMADVVWDLEYSLQLQQSAHSRIP